jgi:hypothetical protein
MLLTPEVDLKPRVVPAHSCATALSNKLSLSTQPLRTYILVANEHVFLPLMRAASELLPYPVSMDFLHSETPWKEVQRCLAIC